MDVVVPYATSMGSRLRGDDGERTGDARGDEVHRSGFSHDWAKGRVRTISPALTLFVFPAKAGTMHVAVPYVTSMDPRVRGMTANEPGMLAATKFAGAASAKTGQKGRVQSVGAVHQLIVIPAKAGTHGRGFAVLDVLGSPPARG